MIKMGSNKYDNKKGELYKIVKHLKKTGLNYRVKAIDLNYRDGDVVSFRNG